ncbi:hypothetical protein [Mycobacterium sp.]|uniref:hypothetical protein n=1 Tax=Mycobacterium sp. TaxID=1785 RepID=UPI003A84EE07
MPKIKLTQNQAKEINKITNEYLKFKKIKTIKYKEDQAKRYELLGDYLLISTLKELVDEITFKIIMEKVNIKLIQVQNKGTSPSDESEFKRH